MGFGERGLCRWGAPLELAEAFHWWGVWAAFAASMLLPGRRAGGGYLQWRCANPCIPACCVLQALGCPVEAA